MKLKTISVKGRDVDVEVTEQGRFTATVGAQVLGAERLDGLVELVEKAIAASKVKVAVPFALASTVDMRRGHATGIHAGNGNILVTYEGGKGDQLRAGGALRPPDEADWAEYKALREAYITAHAALNLWLREYTGRNQFDLREATLAALRDA